MSVEGTAKRPTTASRANSIQVRLVGHEDKAWFELRGRRRPLRRGESLAGLCERLGVTDLWLPPAPSWPEAVASLVAGTSSCPLPASVRVVVLADAAPLRLPVREPAGASAWAYVVAGVAGRLQWQERDKAGMPATGSPASTASTAAAKAVAEPSGASTSSTTGHPQRSLSAVPAGPESGSGTAGDGETSATDGRRPRRESSMRHLEGDRDAQHDVTSIDARNREVDGDAPARSEFGANTGVGVGFLDVAGDGADDVRRATGERSDRVVDGPGSTLLGWTLTRRLPHAGRSDQRLRDLVADGADTGVEEPSSTPQRPDPPGELPGYWGVRPDGGVRGGT